MAWLMQAALTTRWSVLALDKDVERELVDRREAYRKSRPDVFIGYGAVSTHGVHLPLDLFPREAHIQSATKNPPHVLAMVSWGVSEDIKDIIESVEPNVHQFVHVPTFLKNGAAAPRRYFAMVLGQATRDQINLDLTTMRKDSSGRFEMPSYFGNTRGTIVIDRVRTSSWHAWTSKDIWNQITVSDLLKEKIAGKIPGLWFTNIKESG